MKKSFFILLTLVSFNYAFAQMPTLKEVVKEYSKKYLIAIDNEAYPKFQKKKEGWYLVQVRYDNPQEQENLALYWSVKNNSYQEIYYPRILKNNEEIERDFEKLYTDNGLNNEAYFYERNIFFGYNGWDWDVIQEYENRKELTDSMYEALARAYSNYAMGFIQNQFGDLFVNDDEERLLLNDSIKISENRIKKFIYYADNAISTYQKLIEINPAYETMVGNIKLKCANEYLYKYSILKMCNNEVSASKELKNVLYSDSILKISKKYLDIVSKNGILFTYDDNDTYPLWYLQDFGNYRKDVIVINTSLLGLKRYLKMLEVTSKSSLFSSPSSLYYKNNFDYLLRASNYSSRPIFLEDFIKKIINYKSKGSVTKVKQNGDIEINSDVFYKGESIFQYSDNEVIFSNNAKLRLKLKSYIYLNQFMMLDIINSNYKKRDIYCTNYDDFLENVLFKKNGMFKFGLK
jgi:hypothetical protein